MITKLECADAVRKSAEQLFKGEKGNMVMKRLETSNVTTQLFWQCECQEGNGLEFVKFKIDNPVCLVCHSVHWNSPDAYIDNVTDKLIAQRDFIFKNFPKSEAKEFYKPLRFLYDQVIKGDVKLDLFKPFKKENKIRFARKCSHCQKGMNEGYVINGGENYYCKDDCLKTVLSPEEFNELYADGETETYWTEWEDEQEFQWLEIDGVLHEIG